MGEKRDVKENSKPRRKKAKGRSNYEINEEPEDSVNSYIALIKKMKEMKEM